MANVNPILGAAAGAGAHAPSSPSGARLKFAPAAPRHAAHSLARDGCQGRLRGARSPPHPGLGAAALRCVHASVPAAAHPSTAAHAPPYPRGVGMAPAGRRGEPHAALCGARETWGRKGKGAIPARKRPPHQLLCRPVTEWPQLVPSEKQRSTVTKTLGSRGRTGFKPGLSRFPPGGPRARRATSPGPRFLVWEVWAEGLLCIRITKHY